MDSKTDRLIDVLVVGGGPAGTATALNLARLWKVAIVDLGLPSRQRIGESLVPGARRLLSDMGIWESFQAQEHSPCYGNLAVWGSEEPVETDYLRDPDGYGWHIDRAHFDRWLRGIAMKRGAGIVVPARLKTVEWDGECWRVEIQTSEGRKRLIARVLIDGGGRAAPVARLLGVRRKVADKLVCGWMTGRVSSKQGGMTRVEAVKDGWWYSAPLSGGRHGLAFHTDSDLPPAQQIADPGMLMERAQSSSLPESGFIPEASGVAAAHSAVLQPTAGPAWFAVGDAACSFDPLSSQGLFNALFTGFAAAECADRYLTDGSETQTEYSATINHICSLYQKHLSHWYSVETRWSDQPFWQRRHGAMSQSDCPPDQVG